MRRSPITRQSRPKGRIAVCSAICTLVLLVFLGGTSTAASFAAPNPKNPVAHSGAQALEAGCPRGPNSYDIGPGATGTAVREVQCLLNWALSIGAYPYINVDGSYGPITTQGVRVFQICANNRGAGIGVDGRVGPQTLPHLRWWAQHSYDTGERIC